MRLIFNESFVEKEICEFSEQCTRPTETRFSMKKKRETLDMDCTVAMGPTYGNTKNQNIGIEMLSKRVLIKVFVWLKFIWSVFSFLLLCTNVFLNLGFSFIMEVQVYYGILSIKKNKKQKTKVYYNTLLAKNFNKRFNNLLSNKHRVLIYPASQDTNGMLVVDLLDPDLHC